MVYSAAIFGIQCTELRLRGQSLADKVVRIGLAVPSARTRDRARYDPAPNPIVKGCQRPTTAIRRRVCFGHAARLDSRSDFFRFGDRGNLGQSVELCHCFGTLAAPYLPENDINLPVLFRIMFVKDTPT